MDQHPNVLSTIIRGAESFLVVLVVGFTSQITVGGQAIDLTTHAGQVTASTAIVSALVLALRHALVVSGPPSGVG